MGRLSVALLQMAPCGADVAANQAKAEQFCRQAAAAGADLVLFPEMWSVGYSFFDAADAAAHAAWRALAQPTDGPFVRHFQQLAAELGVALAVTYLQAWPERPRNTVTLIDRHGALRLTYAKVHTCEFSIEAACAPGDGFPVAALETAAGEVQVGCMICYDREFPESARLLMLNGAELVLVPNACGLEVNRLSQFRARAYENQMALAMCNYAAPKCNGHSIAFDGMACDERGDRDMLLLEAGAEEGIYSVTVDLARLRAYRAENVWGNAYRRPRLYQALGDETVREPFRRSDATR